MPVGEIEDMVLNFEDELLFYFRSLQFYFMDLDEDELTFGIQCYKNGNWVYIGVCYSWLSFDKKNLILSGKASKSSETQVSKQNYVYVQEESYRFRITAQDTVMA